MIGLLQPVLEFFQLSLTDLLLIIIIIILLKRKGRK